AWPGLRRALAAGRFDLAMGGVTLRPERAVAGVFTRPVVEAGAVVLAHQRLDPRSSWLRLGVNAGGHLERLAARLFPQALLVRTHDNRALGELLASGAADAILTDEAEADALAVPGAVRLVPCTGRRGRRPPVRGRRRRPGAASPRRRSKPSSAPRSERRATSSRSSWRIPRRSTPSTSSARPVRRSPASRNRSWTAPRTWRPTRARSRPSIPSGWPRRWTARSRPPRPGAPSQAPSLTSR